MQALTGVIVLLWMLTKSFYYDYKWCCKRRIPVARVVQEELPVATAVPVHAGKKITVTLTTRGVPTYR